VAYSIQAPGPHGQGYRIAGSPVSCRQLKADAGTINTAWAFVLHQSIKKSLNNNETHSLAILCVINWSLTRLLVG